MAKLFTGRDGRLLLGSDTLVKVADWSLQGDLETLEATTLGDSQRSYVPGVQSFSGRATLLYYQDGTRNDASTLLRKLVKTSGVSTSDAVTLTLRLAGETSNSDVTLTAYITSVNIGASVGEIIKAEISFQATGALATASL